MEFRLVQHGNRASSSGPDLLSPRRISFASEIPLVGLHGFDRTPRPIRLRGVLDAQTESFVAVYGAYRQGPFWLVARRDPFPFDLGDHLPRMAQRAIVPEIVAMERAVAWHGCLENLLAPSSWSRVVAQAWRLERVCFECGSVPFRPDRLEGFEAWSEDPASPYGPVRRLVAIRVLCGPCLSMKHLGEALRRNGFDRAFARLCAVNRIGTGGDAQEEVAAYRKEIEDRHAAPRPECLGWTFDLSVLAGATLHLKESLELRDDGAIGHRGDHAGCIRVTDADVTREGRCVVVRPRGWAG